MQVNTEKTEMALKTASAEVSIFVTNAESEVKKLEDKYLTLVPDASTKDGYKHCKEVRANLMPIKTNLEGVRKTLKAPVLSMGKLIDSSINPLSERVERLYKPFEAAYREKDEEIKRRKQARLDAIDNAFKSFDTALITAVGETSTTIQVILDELADFNLDPNVFQERTDEAATKHSEVMEKLGSMLMSAVNQEEMQAKQKEIEDREKAIQEKEKAEAERARQEALKAEQVEQAKQDEAKRVAREKELQAAREDAQKQAKIDAEAKHKEEMQLAERRAQVQAAQAAAAERQRMEEERAQIQIEAERREANKKHKASIHNAVLAAILTTGITEEQGKEIIKLAASRKAASMYIEY